MSTTTLDRTDPAVTPPPATHSRAARFLLLLAVFVCAACGLVYELALTALGSYLIGNSVTQTSVVISVMVFAMGIGSLAAKPMQRRAVGAFALLEGALALVGGLSVLVLYVLFAWLRIYMPAMVVVSFAVGLLIGAEIPLLMTLLQRIRRQQAGSAVADMFAADYVGALVGGLCFPLLLLPTFGQLKGVLVVGAVNAVAGVVVVLWIFRRETRRAVRIALLTGAGAVLAVLGTVYVLADDIEVTARQQLYRDPIIHAETTAYQDIVITQSTAFTGTPDTRLFLNGDLQFSSVDEYRYHEALVHPALSGKRSSVLILGGGDGLALREVLRYDDVEEVTLVDLDPAMTRLARTFGPLADLNDDAFGDRRVNVVHADAFNWLRDATQRHDAVIIDFPDPDTAALAKLYSVEFYHLLGHVLNPESRVVVQGGSPFFAPKSYWSIAKTIDEAGYRTTEYQVDVPSFGNWGFVLAAPGTDGPPQTVRLAEDAPRLRFLDDAVLKAATVFPVDRRPQDVRASTLMDPVVLEYARHEWQNY
ncbi:polyamine aminopropyltransferase [Streptomyces sp. NL15-2K]|uniref:polyamine aminopropyltransferase n=1 Tax=Streptomyces sp. NL15-2K TaxID=376149 RepID=UPI000F574107|nr:MULTISPECIES: polyamine aminopropyltransferase [Actinomycetes]WKX15003.1 polyamine aminopropyltransferase [Kutzneria buriramensis]GCB51941.1 spermidine synthase [Streptomyces sp. NL15-2K]